MCIFRYTQKKKGYIAVLPSYISANIELHFHYNSNLVNNPQWMHTHPNVNLFVVDSFSGALICWLNG